LAVLTYQHEEEARAAIAALTPLTQEREISAIERAEVLTHLAAALRIIGDTSKSVEAAGRALELAPHSVPAHIQKFLGELDRGGLAAARVLFDGLRGRFRTPGLEGSLEGRLLIEEGRFAEAHKVLLQASQGDARYSAALLLAGAAAAKNKEPGKAWEICLKRGGKIDPFSGAQEPLTKSFVRSADILRPAVGVFASLAKGAGEDPSPYFCEGLVSFVSGDGALASKQFTKVNEIDGSNADAYAYRALLAFKSGDDREAAKLASKAKDVLRSHGLGELAAAMVAVKTSKLNQAQTSASNASTYAPWLLAAKTTLADAMAQQKQTEPARKLLTTVLLSDPDYREAKRVLYKHSL
jgi:tetratricopeptide (TPR) repeat protein